MTYFNKLEEISKILKELESTANSNTQPLSDFFTKEQILELRKYKSHIDSFNKWGSVFTFDDYINMRKNQNDFEKKCDTDRKNHDKNQNDLKKFY
jgi:hypothetical protein